MKNLLFLLGLILINSCSVDYPNVTDGHFDLSNGVIVSYTVTDSEIEVKGTHPIHGGAIRVNSNERHELAMYYDGHGSTLKISTLSSNQYYCVLLGTIEGIEFNGVFYFER